MEEVDFLCGLVGSNEKEGTDMKLDTASMKHEIVDMKQKIADLKLEKAGMKLYKYVSIWSSMFFRPIYESLLPSATQLNYWASDNTENHLSTDVKRFIPQLM